MYTECAPGTILYDPYNNNTKEIDHWHEKDGHIDFRPGCHTGVPPSAYHDPCMIFTRFNEGKVRN